MNAEDSERGEADLKEQFERKEADMRLSRFEADNKGVQTWGLSRGRL